MSEEITDKPEERFVFTAKKRVRTPTVIQMEAVECGAAALTIILAYHGLRKPLEEMRIECGVSRDGSKASNVLKAARRFGLEAKGYKKENLEDLLELDLPFIVFWSFNHFLVVEGFGKDKVYLNDPATGPRVVTTEEFDAEFSGVVLTFSKGPDFKTGGSVPNLFTSLAKRIKGSGTALAYVILAGLALVVPGLILPTFSKIFVDDYLVAGRTAWIGAILWGMFAAMSVQVFLTWLQQYHLLRLETKMALSTSSSFLWHVLRLPLEFFNQRFGGEIGSRVQLNDRVAQLLSGELATNALNVVMVVFYASLMFFYDVLLTTIGIAVAALNIIFLRYFSRVRVDANLRLQQDDGKLTGVAMAGIQQIETLKASGAESDFFSQWSGYHAKVMNAEQEMGATTQYLTTIPPLLTALNTAAILCIGAFRVMSGDLTMGSLVAFQTLMASFLAPINALVNLGNRLQDAQGDMNRLDDVLRYSIDVQWEQEEDRTEKAEEPSTVKLQGYLELKDITFGYSPLDPPLIENFNLSLRPGMRVALVGPSGCGKSTISRLVTGLFKPWGGQVLFDGIPREEVPREVLTNSMALVDQDIFLFEGTIRENLSMWDTSYPEQKIIQAAKDAAIHDIIAARPGAYESMVSEGGSNFSGGQRQRLEIARALVGDPSIVIMDEGTSALDPTTEKFVDRNLRRRGCTCLIIAHRLSTIRDCDEIIVLKKGEVMQRGTHEQLMEEGGIYAQLVED